MFSVYKKEIKIYFTSIMGYCIMGIYLAISALLFWGYFAQVNNSSDFSSFFSDMNTVNLFIVPILTIRLLAEEKKLGTYELLMTSPISSWEIIIGKALSVFTFTAIGNTLLLLYPLILSPYTSIEWGIIIAGYSGILFSSMLFISFGMVASSLTDNYVIAALFSLLFILIFMIISFFANSGSGIINRILKEISYSNHYFQFVTGMIKAENLLYFIIGSFLGLYSSKLMIESRTWA